MSALLPSCLFLALATPLLAVFAPPPPPPHGFRRDPFEPNDSVKDLSRRFQEMSDHILNSPNLISFKTDFHNDWNRLSGPKLPERPMTLEGFFQGTHAPDHSPPAAPRPLIGHNLASAPPAEEIQQFFPNPEENAEESQEEAPNSIQTPPPAEMSQQAEEEEAPVQAQTAPPAKSSQQPEVEAPVQAKTPPPVVQKSEESADKGIVQPANGASQLSENDSSVVEVSGSSLEGGEKAEDVEPAAEEAQTATTVRLLTEKKKKNKTAAFSSGKKSSE